MKIMSNVDQGLLERSDCLAESNEFAIYRLDKDTFALVQRHQGMPWQGVTLSGDGIFRVGELWAKAARTLYRDLAARLRPERQPM